MQGGRRIVAIVAALAVVAGGLMSTGQHAAAVSTLPGVSSPNCADILIIGVRGSGEEAGYGPKVATAVDELKLRIGNTRVVRELALDYPAAPMSALKDDLAANLVAASEWTYFDSIDAGVAELTDVLITAARECPQEKWMLVGYSQGALVVDGGTRAFTEPGRYAGILLIADPGRVAENGMRNFGNAGSGGDGLMSHFGLPFTPLDSALRPVAVELCNEADTVCDTPALPTLWWPLGVSTHTDSYSYANTANAVDALHTQLMGIPAPAGPQYVGVVPFEQFESQMLTRPLRSGVTATWRLAPGASLPDGVTLSSSGMLSGSVGPGYFPIALEVVGVPSTHTVRTTVVIRSGKDPDTVVTFADAHLAACVRSALSLPAGADIMQSALSNLRWVICHDPVKSLAGLESAYRLENLSLFGSDVADLSPIAGAKLMTMLQIEAPRLTSLAPLSGLVDLESIDLLGTSVANLAPLGTLSKLRNLTISGGPVADLTAVGSLDALETLVLSNVSSAPLAPLAGLPALRNLTVSYTPVTGLGVVTQLPALSALEIIGADLPSSAFSGLGSTTGITHFNASGNALTSIDFLAPHTSMVNLYLSGNLIEDVAVVSRMPSLGTLRLDRNRIADFTPLVGRTASIHDLRTEEQSILLPDATVGDPHPLPVVRTPSGTYLTPTLSSGEGIAEGALTGTASAGHTITWTTPGVGELIWGPGSSPQARGLQAVGTGSAVVGSEPFIHGEPGPYAVLVADPGAWYPLPVTYSYQWLRDGEPIPGATGETYEVVAADYGHALAVRVTGSKTGFTSATRTSQSLPVARPVEEIPVERIAGADRFATAVEVARQFADADTVYLANGLNFPDALSAAPAAAVHDAPLLLTGTASLPAVVAAEIARIAPSRIVVVGGEGAVGPGVVASLRALVPGASIVRLAGRDRYETSRLVTADAFTATGADRAFIATGRNFPDALAASAAAGAASAPVILVPGEASKVDEPTIALMTTLGVADVFIAGGTGVVSAGIESSLQARFGEAHVKRLAGTSRYETSAAINDEMFQTSSRVYLAVGTGFADALAGAALAGRDRAPLFVVRSTCVPTQVRESISALDAETVTLLGGEGALNPSVAAMMACG